MSNQIQNSIIGQKFNRLTVIDRDKKYICQCECGNIVKVVRAKLISGHTKSCGCWRRDNAKMIYNDLTGQKFGRLTVLYKTDKRKQRKIIWHCLCDCGNECDILSTRFNNGTNSCGCIRNEMSSARLKQYMAEHTGPKHHNWNGGFSRDDRHKLMDTSQYKTWRQNVFKRDKFRCVVCKANKNLVAHHIESYREFETLRCDINNGVTLCKFCHNQFHSIYGKKGFDSADFMEFVYDKFA